MNNRLVKITKAVSIVTTVSGAGLVKAEMCWGVGILGGVDFAFNGGFKYEVAEEATDAEKAKVESLNGTTEKLRGWKVGGYGSLDYFGGQDEGYSIGAEVGVLYKSGSLETEGKKDSSNTSGDASKSVKSIYKTSGIQLDLYLITGSFYIADGMVNITTKLGATFDFNIFKNELVDSEGKKKFVETANATDSTNSKKDDKKNDKKQDFLSSFNMGLKGGLSFEFIERMFGLDITAAYYFLKVCDDSKIKTSLEKENIKSMIINPGVVISAGIRVNILSMINYFNN